MNHFYNSYFPNHNRAFHMNNKYISMNKIPEESLQDQGYLTTEKHLIELEK